MSSEKVFFQMSKGFVYILFLITGSNLKEFMRRYCPQDLPEMRTYSHHNIFISLHSLFVKSGRFLQGMPERVGVPFDFVRIWGMHFKDGDVILRYKEQKLFSRS